jgi:hypothetical protein
VGAREQSREAEDVHVRTNGDYRTIRL